MTDKINLYVNTGYRKADETTTNLRVIVPSGLINRMVKIILHCLFGCSCCITMCWEHMFGLLIYRNFCLCIGSNMSTDNFYCSHTHITLHYQDSVSFSFLQVHLWHLIVPEW